MGIKDFVMKRCFFTTKEGTRGCMVHRSVVLDDGSIVRWNKKSGDWKIEGPERWDSAVATSLSRYAMCTAHSKGKMRRDVEEFSLFAHFAARLTRLVDVDTATEIVMFLKGGK